MSEARSSSVEIRPGAEAPVPALTREELWRRLGDRSFTLVNVLSPEAFAHARIPGSVSLPVEEIPERARRELPDLDREIVLYCGSFT